MPPAALHHPSLVVSSRSGARLRWRAANMLLLAALPITDLAGSCRIGRRSARRSCRHPENRRPYPGVLAAQRRHQARLMSATHRR